MFASPRLRLTGLNLRTEDETYSKEMRMSGTLAKRKVEEAAKQ